MVGPDANGGLDSSLLSSRFAEGKVVFSFTAGAVTSGVFVSREPQERQDMHMGSAAGSEVTAGNSAEDKKSTSLRSLVNIC